MAVYRHNFCTHDTQLVMRTLHVSYIVHMKFSMMDLVSHICSVLVENYISDFDEKAQLLCFTYKRHVGAFHLITLTDELKVGILAIFPVKVRHSPWNLITSIVKIPNITSDNNNYALSHKYN